MGNNASTGAIVGLVIGAALAPFTGGTSLAMSVGTAAAIGAGTGAAVGTGLDYKEASDLRKEAKLALLGQNKAVEPPPELEAPTRASLDAQAAEAAARKNLRRGRANLILSGQATQEQIGGTAKTLLGA